MNAQTLAFPSAKGYGKYATGGRGGVVVAVTNLKDYIPGVEDPIEGSFRWAFTQGKDSTKNKWGTWVYSWKPLTVVFKVGGVIDLKADFSLNRSNVTIAGQTALGDGICFKNYTIKLGGNRNGIIRYLRSRPGDVTGEETSGMRWENGGNFIIDHCSLSWAIEETTHFSSADNFTVQWCIVSEGLYNSIHKKGPRGYGTQWGGQYSTYHHNLLAHHQSRSPRINGANKDDIESLVDFRNNVNFNWGSSGACYGGEWEVPGGKGFAHTNFVNNYYQKGPGTASSLYFASPSYHRQNVTPAGYGKWYFDGNVMEGDSEKTADNWKGVNTGTVGGKDNIYSAIEFVQSDGILEDHSSYTETAINAYESILDKAGAIYPKRDGHDERLIREMKGEIPILRSVYNKEDFTSPARGVNSGIIDTPWNLKPANAGDDWDPWYSYYTTVDYSQAPQDSDHDGMPDEWEQANGLDPNDPEDRNLVTEEGYTALEVYLCSLVDEKIDPIFKSSIEDIKNNVEIKISVNKDKLSVLSDSSVKNIKIFDTVGQQVVNAMNTDSVDISNLTNGIYIVEAIVANNQKQILKFNKY
ncbi:T9SS type A sorting domain-containing protein [Dysgonomonas sp. 520]|uniref:T9SS type A sorting domain-containing protein n=1 Tax=Dysgonomonas sp. 520 TaxID=2302931 RepID=UPI0013D02353|nr:T9SS type A sorting domain-containing protein [Dysgonomonas sp. 520]